jgi:hypothetical protein
VLKVGYAAEMGCGLNAGGVGVEYEVDRGVVGPFPLRRIGPELREMSHRFGLKK